MWFNKEKKQTIEDLYNRISAIQTDLIAFKGELSSFDFSLRQLRGKVIKHISAEEEEEESAEEEDLTPKGLKSLNPFK
jgi:hypothetical protein